MKQENWPAWATEAIIIKEYDPAWPAIAVSLINELNVLYNFDSKGFEHIGSTAVVNLPAKPVIDLIAPIDNLDAVDAIAKAVKVENWNLILPDLDNKGYRRTFVKVINDKRFAHFHLVLESSDELKRHIAFRDILRQNPSLAQDYARLKTDLATRYKNDREKYTDAKADFIKSALKQYLS
jgi:GrpB-like predicted nucleotidyltransferase (UPF0157 family)